MSKRLQQAGPERGARGSGPRSSWQRQDRAVGPTQRQDQGLSPGTGGKAQSRQGHGETAGPHTPQVPH